MMRQDDNGTGESVDVRQDAAQGTLEAISHDKSQHIEEQHEQGHSDRVGDDQEQGEQGNPARPVRMGFRTGKRSRTGWETFAPGPPYCSCWSAMRGAILAARITGTRVATSVAPPSTMIVPR